MPSKAEKLLESLRRSKSGRTRLEIDKVYEGYGFIIEGGGNHDKVYHPEFPQVFGFLPRHRTVASYIVRELIENIDRLEALRREQGQ